MAPDEGRSVKARITSSRVEGCSAYGCYQRSGKDGGEPLEVSGTVMTPHGFVRAYSWSPAPEAPPSKAEPHSSYTIVIKGRCYYAGERRARTLRGLVIMAGKFARKVAQR